MHVHTQGCTHTARSIFKNPTAFLPCSKINLKEHAHGTHAPIHIHTQACSPTRHTPPVSTDNSWPDFPDQITECRSPFQVVSEHRPASIQETADGEEEEEREPPCHPPTGFKKRTKWAGSEGARWWQRRWSHLSLPGVWRVRLQGTLEVPAGVLEPPDTARNNLSVGEGPRKDCQDPLLNKMTMRFLFYPGQRGWGCRQDRGSDSLIKSCQSKL